MIKKGTLCRVLVCPSDGYAPVGYQAPIWVSNYGEYFFSEYPHRLYSVEALESYVVVVKALEIGTWVEVKRQGSVGVALPSDRYPPVGYIGQLKQCQDSEKFTVGDYPGTFDISWRTIDPDSFFIKLDGPPIKYPSIDEGFEI